jgi:2-polyprenyl-6-methoxyphenol hydroxylase-like FAD-dependent oxidoreductase
MPLLIVGAGPVGLTLAVACRQHGVPFRLIDRAPAPSTVSKALVVWSGTIEALAALGLAETFVAHALECQGLHLTDRGRTLGRIPTEEGIESRYAWPLCLPQSRTEALLAAHLRAQGIEIEREVELVDLRPGPDAVRGQLRHAGGRVEDFTADYVAGCDGARSAVRHHLPVEFEGETVDGNFILVDAKIEGGGPAQSEVYISFSKTGPVALLPLDPGLWRVFCSRPTQENQEPPTLAEMQGHLDSAGLAHWKLADPIWLSYFLVNERVASRLRVGRVFLCGDAAHIHSPAGGQGMNTGMQDAFNLAWKLKLLREGVADSEAVAESYHHERHAVAKMVVGGTSKLFRAARMRNPFLTEARKLAASFLVNLPVVQRFASEKSSELGIVYEPSPLAPGEAGAWPADAAGIPSGRRARDVALETAAGAIASLWEHTFASDYTLLFFSGHHPGPESAIAASDLAAAALALRPALNFVGIWHGYQPPAGSGTWLRDAAAAAHQRYGVGHQTAWYLVRPDQYIAARSQPADLDALRAALAPVAAKVI